MNYDQLLASIVTLTNGKRVANFSSPHSFEFTDGTILPAVSNEDAEKYKVTFIEQEVNDKGDLLLRFDLTQDIMDRMEIFLRLAEDKLVDVVFIPLAMLTALRAARFWNDHQVLATPFRSIRIEDRIKKLVSIKKQCV